MKQNERLLVYAVTCFLAVILVFAVVFGNDSKAATNGENGGNGSAVRDLGAILDEGRSQAADPAKPTGSEAGRTESDGAAQPGPGSGEAPLHAKSPALVAAELVAQQLGPSRRDYSVRYVMPRAGDTLETLVQRWCGSREFLEKARRLNEDLRVVQLGKEVGLPWVDDAALLEIHAARQGERLAPRQQPVVDETAVVTPPAGPRSRFDELLRQVPQQPVNQTPVTQTPANQGPVNQGTAIQAAIGTATDASATRAKDELAAATRYEVKSGDSWWRIADRTYGRKNADKMVKEMQRTNPGAGDVLKVGQVLLLPPKP
jgi:LysM repeat protein